MTGSPLRLVLRWLPVALAVAAGTALVWPIATGSLTPTLWAARAVVVIVGLLIWHWTQSLIGQRAVQAGVVGDILHQWTGGVHRFLCDHTALANALLIAGSFCIDALGIFLLGASIFGPTLRPFLGLLLLFGLRQVCQALCVVPPPPGIIWRDPGASSLLVTYHVGNDMFFSGHTALAVYGACEMARIFDGVWVPALWVMAIALAASVLLLRAHYTMDVFTGAVVALLVDRVAADCAPAADAWLNRIAG